MTTKSTTASLMAWRGDWHRRIAERVQKRGYGDVTAYAAAAPTRPLLELAAQLDEEYGEDGVGDVAAEQLQRMLFEEARARGELERCARELLVREIYTNLPEGWHSVWIDIPGDTTTSAWRRAAALGDWTADIAIKVPEHATGARGITKALRDAPLPEGWLPRDADDPILVDLFARFWKDG